MMIVSQQAVAREKVRQRDAAQPSACGSQELAAAQQIVTGDR
jgi:hypothetical protein